MNMFMGHFWVSGKGSFSSYEKFGPVTEEELMVDKAGDYDEEEVQYVLKRSEH